MYVDSEMTHIRHLILSGKEREGKSELIRVLTENPYLDQAWTLAAQLTSDAEQRKLFVKRVFDCSDNMELADWGFLNFSKLEMGQEREISIPPSEYLAMQNHRRLAMDELVDLALNPPAPAPEPAFRLMTEHSQEPPEHSVEPIALLSPSLVNQNNVSKADHSRAVNEPMVESTLPLFSLKTIGKWTIVAAGVFFIAIMYSPYLLFWFMQFRIYPFYHCVLPMAFLGAVTLFVGYLIKK
jgi:hypothetical protein